MRIAIIGAGSVGTNLHHALELKGIRAELVHARPLTGEESEKAIAALPAADVYVYTVADHALREVVAKVGAPKALHVHTSGSMPIEVFGDDKPHCGVMYFLQSFSREHLIDDWSGIPCFIEGKNIDDVAAIYSLALTVSSRIYEANQHDRERLHVAAVFANNYSNLMYRIAAEILKETQIPFEALLPLIDNTSAKIHKMTPKEAQTGPAKRNDQVVMAHQAEIVGELKIKNYELGEASVVDSFSGEELREVYQSLAALIVKGQNH